MTQEAKVGAFTLAGLALIMAVVLHFGDLPWTKDKGYPLYVGFHKVLGIYPGSKVMLSGVPVGSVKNVVNDGGGVMVTLSVNDGVKIPRASTVSVEAAGVMSEKFISIIPSATSQDYLTAGEYLMGEEEAGIDGMFAELTKTVVQVQELLGSMNDIVGDPLFKGSVVDMAVNIRDASAHIKGMTEAMESMATENRMGVREMVNNLTQVTAGLQRTMSSVEATMANVESLAGDPATTENIKLTLKNIAETSQRIDHIAANLEGTFADPKTAEDLKKTVQNARELTDKANNMMGKVSEIEVKPSVELMYSGAAHDWRTDFDLNVGQKEGAFLDLGVESIGEDNKINAQVGKRSGSIGYRGGVVASKFGVGLDAYAGDKWKFSAEAYDLNKVTLRLRTEYEFAEDTYLLGELDDVTDRKDNRRTYVGLKRTF